MARDINMPLALDEIVVPAGRREVVVATVKRLASSIEEIGLRHPITVRQKGEQYILVAGLHRLEAFRKLGREHIPAIISTFTNADARLWEIAENLHRADLSVQQRSDQVAEWVKLTEEKVSAQVAPKGNGRPEGGINAASRDLGIERTQVQRAVKIASISEDAKEAAREAGLDDNQSALLKVASSPVGEQVAAVHRLHAARTVEASDPLTDADAIEKQVAALMSAWNRACKDARDEFLSRVDQPVMDRRVRL